MTTHYETFKDAIQREKVVVAHVLLFDGTDRIRIGPVAHVTNTHVTIYDALKGFRTTPLGMVFSATIQEEKTSWLGRVWKRLLRWVEDGK